MARRRFRNLLALAVLATLAERPMHPYEISQTLRERAKDQSIKLNYGALYSVVDALASAGFIEARETVRAGKRPERTIYAITPAGQEECESWLSELLSTPVREYHSLEAALALVAALPPDAVQRLLDERARRLRIEIASLEESLSAGREQGLSDLFLVEVEFRLAMLRAEREYAAGLAAAIRDGRLAGVGAWRRIHELLEQGRTFTEILQDPVGLLGEEGRILLRLTGGGP